MCNHHSLTEEHIAPCSNRNETIDLLLSQNTNTDKQGFFSTPSEVEPAVKQVPEEMLLGIHSQLIIESFVFVYILLMSFQIKILGTWSQLVGKSEKAQKSQ